MKSVKVAENLSAGGAALRGLPHIHHVMGAIARCGRELWRSASGGSTTQDA